MSRHPLFIASSFLLLCACPGGSEESDSATAGEDTSATGGIILPTTPASTGEDPGTTTALPTTSVGESTAAAESTTGDDINCGVADIQADVRIPRVMLVLDKSRSMVIEPGGYWDADGDDADGDNMTDADGNMSPATPKVTRWKSLYSVVDFIVTNFESRMDFGAALFPATTATGTYDAGACKVNPAPEVAVGTDMGQTILMTIPGPDQTNQQGGTPAAAGMATGIAGLPRNEALSEEEDLRYIILVTDGAANCASDAATDKDRFEVYDAHFPEMVAAAKDAGIPTFVVGIDIRDEASPVKGDGNPDATNTYDKLNEVAEIGGQPRLGDEKFYNSLNQLELQAALEAISQEITSCTFQLSTPLTDSQFVRELNVQLDKDPMTATALEYGKDQVTDCATESGWHFTDETRSAIELCGDACTTYKSIGLVDIIFDCIQF